MTRARALCWIAWLAPAACAGAQVSPVANRAGANGARTEPSLLVSLCPIVMTAAGADVDDAGVAVELVEDVSRPPRRIARIGDGCRKVGRLAHHEVARAECRDPHVDATFVVRVERPQGDTVIVEVLTIDDQSGRTGSIARQRIAVDRATRVQLTIGGSCTLEPE